MKALSILIITLVLISCNAKRATEDSADFAGMEKAEVRKYDVDGCGFMLFLESGRKLNPDNLTDEFKKEGLKVWVQYTVKKNAMSICMAGDNVAINKISLRK